MLKKIHTLIAFFLICCISNYTLSYADEVNPSQNAFSKLGVILNDNVLNTYFAGDTILVKGRVTDKKEYALLYIEHVETGKEMSILARTNSNGTFQIPVTLPDQVGRYYFIVASGNSFTSSVPQYITLVPQKTITATTKSNISSISPVVIYEKNMPYLYFGDDMWATMKLEQSGKIINRSGKIISLDKLPIAPGMASVTIEGNYLSTPSSLDQISALNFTWSRNIFIDRTRDVIGKELVSFKTRGSIMVMDFTLKKGEELYSDYYLTLPNGSVNRFKFDESYIDKNGFLKTGIRIQQSFAIPDLGVYKIETVRSNGLAYFNIPVSKNPFWSVIPPITDRQITTLRQDKKIVDRYVLKNINIIRSKLRKPPLIIDPTLTSLAQAKANDMATYNYIGHSTQNGLGIIEFGNTIGIKIQGAIGENVAGGNISDISLQDGLEESGSHRYAMISDKYKKIGIGYVLKNGKTYLVQLFGE